VTHSQIVGRMITPDANQNNQVEDQECMLRSVV